jgi:hypothetical protein
MAETMDSAPFRLRQSQKSPSSYVYLLHFSAPIGNEHNPHGLAQHYLGLAPDGTINRVLTHKQGRGAAITRAAVNAYHRTMRLARTWNGGADLERKLKAYKNSPLLCPICNEGALSCGNFYSLMTFDHLTTEEIERRIGTRSRRRTKATHLNLSPF